MTAHNALTFIDADGHVLEPPLDMIAFAADEDKAS